MCTCLLFGVYTIFHSELQTVNVMQEGVATERLNVQTHEKERCVTDQLYLYVYNYISARKIHGDFIICIKIRCIRSRTGITAGEIRNCNSNSMFVVITCDASRFSTE